MRLLNSYQIYLHKLHLLTYTNREYCAILFITISLLERSPGDILFYRLRKGEGTGSPARPSLIDAKEPYELYIYLKMQ